MRLCIRSSLCLALLVASTALGQDRFEPNDQIEKAASVNLDETIEVSLEPTGDRDFFRVQVGAVGTLKIEFSELPAGMTTPEHVVYSQGAIEYSRDTTVTVMAGTYTVGFWAPAGATSRESFRFTARFTPVGTTGSGAADSDPVDDPSPKPNPADETEDDSPYRWTGTLEVESKILGTGTKVGEQIKTWSYQIKWREVRRLEVHDDQGRLTGEFVELAEDGSSWAARTAGTFQDQDKRTVISGEGSGTGSIQHGWIYFSLSDQDPLAGKLANGTYMAHGDQSMVYEALYQYISPRGSHESRSPMFAGFNIGRLNWYPYQAQGPFRASDIAPALSGINNPGGDSSPRTLTDGVMAGSYTAVLPWAQNTTHTATWRIARDIGVRANLDRPDRHWRPLGPPLNDVIQLTAELLQPEGVAGKFRFTLSEISSEKGYALNAGNESENDLDFEFDFDSMSEHYSQPFHPEDASDGWRIESEDLLTRTTVYIRALDYGAWARLKAEVNVDGQWHSVDIEGGGSETTLPLDQDEDRIADGWEEDHDVVQEDGSSDQDDAPEVIESQGDGFTNYEEYRGFEVMGVWTDTDPRARDVFVYDEIGFGTGLFHAAGLEIHVIDQGEYDGDRVVNHNRGKDSLGPQKGLYLCEGSLESGIMGRVEPSVGTPNVVEKVMIDLDNHAFFLNAVDPAQYDSLQDYATAGAESGSTEWLETWNEQLEDLRAQLAALEANYSGSIEEEINKDYLERDIQELEALIQRTEEGFGPQADAAVANLEQTIAHELGHGVAIPHHGKDWGQCPGDISPTGTPTMGGKWSGVQTCIMRYTISSKYIDAAGTCQEYTDPDPPQTHYCESKGGDGDTGVCGPATDGECLLKITLKGDVRR